MEIVHIAINYSIAKVLQNEYVLSCIQSTLEYFETNSCVAAKLPFSESMWCIFSSLKHCQVITFACKLARTGLLLLLTMFNTPLSCVLCLYHMYRIIHSRRYVFKSRLSWSFGYGFGFVKYGRVVITGGVEITHCSSVMFSFLVIPSLVRQYNSLSVYLYTPHHTVFSLHSAKVQCEKLITSANASIMIHVVLEKIFIGHWCAKSLQNCACISVLKPVCAAR